MHSQLQPHNLGKIGSHPWRPRFGYEAEITPLAVQPKVNLLEDTCTLHGMMTEPLKFPNLITGFDRNPKYAARAALYMRYTPYDWKQNQIRLYNEADVNRNCSEKLRKDIIRSIQEIDANKQLEKIKSQQIEDGLISTWQNELASELEKLIIQNSNIQDCRQDLQITIHNLESQLHITQECLHHRECRKGTDLVHDKVEIALLKEIEIARNCQQKLAQLMDECINQSTSGRAIQNQLINIQKKEIVGIDSKCYQTNNFDQNSQYNTNVGKYDSSVNKIGSCTETLENVVKVSQAERIKSSHLRDVIGTSINAVRCEMLKAWICTNNALVTRNTELCEAKKILQTHLYKIQQEIFEIEKNLTLMQKMIADENSVLKAIRTQVGSYRSEAEPCKNDAQLKIIKEIENINETIYCMNVKLRKFEAQHQQLLHTKFNLESDLKSKMDALFIDKEKCIGIRRSYPISS